LVALDPVSGDLLAAVGGTDFTTSPYNRALQARRQPGSAIKPLIYAAALEQGITAASRWDDGPVSYPRGNGQVWQPQNYGNKRHGTLTLREALASSNNVIAVKLLETIGIQAYSELATRLGLTPRLQDLSLALGTDEVTLHELVLAYAPLANGGYLPQPRSILRSYDSYRKSWTEQPPANTPVLSAESAYITTQLLKEVLISGTARSLKTFSQQHPAAGKTGTTNDYHDAWFIGYTPQLVAGVWLGYDQPRPGGRGFTGGAVAAPLWQRFMAAALANRPAIDFSRPETVLAVRIDPVSGLLAGPDCPQQREEYFRFGTEPTEYCPLHGSQPEAADSPLPGLTAEPSGD
jgi:membrane carboxypeptidase/penicillin-binding protein